MKTKAVITGDIINFTKLAPIKRQALIQDTESLLKTWIKEQENAEIFRGDSYQALFENVLEAIRRSIQLICWFKKHSDIQHKIDLGTRISIGIGDVSYQGKNVLNSDGEAFHLSGRNFDKMKAGEFLAIHTSDTDKNKGIEIILNFVNKYISNWTLAQAEVIFLILEGKTQQEIAEELSLSQPSINSRLKSAGWKEFEPTIDYIAYLVQ
jgi:hypothetical protein